MRNDPSRSGGATRLGETLLGPWSAFTISPSGQSHFDQRIAVPASRLLSPRGILSHHATWSGPNARHLLGLGSGTTWAVVSLHSRGASWTSRTSFRFLHALLANIECQRTMSGVDWHPARRLLGPQGFAPSHRTATWPTRLRGTLPVTATESEITARFSVAAAGNLYCKAPLSAIPELLSMKDLACSVRDCG